MKRQALRDAVLHPNDEGLAGLEDRPKSIRPLGLSKAEQAAVDSHGRAVLFALAPDQAHEVPMTSAMLQSLPDAPMWVVANRGYLSNAIRTQVWDMSARPAIPAKRNEAVQRCPDFIYVHRNQVERLWGSLKELRIVATRYDKTARPFLSMLCLAPARDWLEPTIKHQNSRFNRCYFPPGAAPISIGHGAQP